MVRVLGRGGFCPKERRQAEGLVALHREMEVGYCKLVTISTDNVTETNERFGFGSTHGRARRWLQWASGTAPKSARCWNAAANRVAVHDPPRPLRSKPHVPRAGGGRPVGDFPN
jgi:hypothetical protein